MAPLLDDGNDRDLGDLVRVRWGIAHEQGVVIVGLLLRRAGLSRHRDRKALEDRVGGP